MCELSERAKRLYPSSEHLQTQWVNKTKELMLTGKHALQTGGWSVITRRSNHAKSST